jgi:hypothetical protein
MRVLYSLPTAAENPSTGRYAGIRSSWLRGEEARR